MKLEYERAKSALSSQGRIAEGLATAFAIVILLALVAGAIWLGYFMSSFASQRAFF